MRSIDGGSCKLGRMSLVAAIGGAAVGTAVAQDGQPDPAALGAYKAELHPVNNSGVSGIATLVESMDGVQLTVIVAARNLEPGQTHPQHIHGLEGGEASRCATLMDDMNGDNLITLDESVAVSGPALLPLEPFPMSADGTVTYGQMLDMAPLGAEPLTNRVVELHGMTVPGQGYVETMPVACGRIVPALPELLLEGEQQGGANGGAGDDAGGAGGDTGPGSDGGGPGSDTGDAGSGSGGAAGGAGASGGSGAQ